MLFKCFCAFLNQILYLCNKVAIIATNINIEDMRSVLFIVLILVSIMMEAKIRKPAVAGSFYADDAKELRQDVRDCFSQCKNPVMEHVQAVIVPHAGYVFSGVTAASAFAVIHPEAEYEHICLKPYLNERNLFVISSDFSHYPAYMDAKLVDGLTKDSIMTGKTEAFVNATLHNQKLNIGNLATSACGMAPIATLLMMTEKNAGIHPHHIMYCNSGDSPYGGKDKVVGYHSFVFTTQAASFELTQDDKKMLKSIAYHTIKASLEGKKYEPSGLSDMLKTRCGAFVSLHKKGRLRGCIGHFGEDMPLYQTVVQMAKAAAFEDPRFYGVTLDELDDIDIEISVLTPMKRIHSIDEFQLGKQGIFMRKGYHTGTFLPQVADEVAWTKEEFLGHCAQDKAGIGWDGWKTAELYTYEAIVF